MLPTSEKKTSESSTLKKEAALSSGIFLHIYQTTRRHVSDDQYIHIYLHGRLKSHTLNYLHYTSYLLTASYITLIPTARPSKGFQKWFWYSTEIPKPICDDTELNLYGQDCEYEDRHSCSISTANTRANCNSGINNFTSTALSRH